MVQSRLKYFIFIFLLMNAGKLLSQAIRFSPSSLVFINPTFTTGSDSATVNITNNGCGYLKVDYCYCAVPEFKITDTTAFILAPATSKILRIKFLPRQNIEYNSSVILHTTSGDFGFPVKGFGKFVEAYYDSTYNKFDETLKSTLNTLLATNYTSYSYNAARDKMFMEFDNKKTNGQGATQNTLECIYTGRLAVAYTSRTDCQTNFSFNTEHTWPQSLFGSNLPMVSDLNHLFPTDDAANNYRGNNPFGMVSSPSWSNGGSKGISTLFEPRDAQKGRTARAMLYFAIRYNNPAYGLVTFFGPQESILRTWCMQFLPDAGDRKRNDDIFGYQKNRNPFIDHPEFLERITSIANNSVAPVKSLIRCDTQYIAKNYFVYDSVNYKVIVYNNGNTNINCSKIECTQNNFTVSYPSYVISPQTSLEISLQKFISNSNTVTDTLVIENNSTNFPSIRIPINITNALLKITSSKTTIATTGDSAVLSLTSTGTVSWNTGATGTSLTVKNAGIYFASVTDSAGCHHTDTVTITKNSSGIACKSVRGFNVFPNPSGDFIYLNNSANEMMQYSLVNSIGQLILSFQAASNGLTEIDVRQYPTGIYFLQNEEGVGVKVIISRF